MITNQIIQKSIDELKLITRIDLVVYSLEGNIVASTTPDEDAKDGAGLIPSFVESVADSQVVGYNHLLKIYDEDELLFIVNAIGAGEDAYVIGKVAVSELQALIVAYHERFDKNSFFQNLLLDNMLLVDVYNRARKLRIDNTVSRVVLLVETKQGNDAIVTELLRGIFLPQSGDVVTTVDENYAVVVKTLGQKDSEETIQVMAEQIVSLLNTEALLDAKVSFGTVVNELRDVSKSYKEAKMAMEVGRIFYAGNKVAAYSSLGIGRLIYQLPENLCSMFVKEIFGDDVPEELDEETRNILDKFLENDMNVSEASKQLFLARNTLVYRILKVEKATGLDLRKFEDAMTYKIAMMVDSYLKYLHQNNK